MDGTHKRLLHIAPEMVFVAAFGEIPHLSYVSGDLENPRAQQRMDITKIGYPDDSFDIIYCSHVLEHIPEDHLALRELYRVCKPGGWGLLQVPITTERTFEDPTAVTPQQRLAVFGQDDHVRRCGLDYADRIRSAGFTVQVVSASAILSPEQFEQMGITKRGRYVFYCSKPV
jgi:ubiquinone/menaquinone biosynthesis C-methylase UbiE